MKADHPPRVGKAVRHLECGSDLRSRVLLVDDDADMRRVNLEALSGSGYHVDAVEDGAIAWETLQKTNYDLLVTDNNMPKVTGIALVKKLRAARMALPVIMATGNPPEEFHHPSLQPAVVLLKPYTIPELLGTVENVLRATAMAPNPIPSPDSQNQSPANGWLL
ncbi:MAG TPA: response regulator [Candidatus Paceibacterota bacterium]|nr:response regulator [Candidatus Paceibacterota bacterium]